jgi:hypothetical protein
MAILGQYFGRGASGDGVTHPDRVYLFAGDFADEADMFAYCFTPVTPNGPEQLNLDLPDASVATQKIDAAFGDQVIPRLSEYFGTKARRRVQRKMQPDEALVLIPTAAFDGQAFQLHSTNRLRFLGHETSLTPTVQAMTS